MARDLNMIEIMASATTKVARKMGHEPTIDEIKALLRANLPTLLEEWNEAIDARFSNAWLEKMVLVQAYDLAKQLAEEV